mmetsp:Transcript_15752/g.49485  ORF Transcript_15752/g.49485 Transcript_15752/m.49485 type:complete len:204 (+) Transcript_15752:114-725(+)
MASTAAPPYTSKSSERSISPEARTLTVSSSSSAMYWLASSSQASICAAVICMYPSERNTSSLIEDENIDWKRRLPTMVSMNSNCCDTRASKSTSSPSSSTAPSSESSATTACSYPGNPPTKRCQSGPSRVGSLGSTTLAKLMVRVTMHLRHSIFTAVSSESLGLTGWVRYCASCPNSGSRMGSTSALACFWNLPLIILRMERI